MKWHILSISGHTDLSTEIHTTYMTFADLIENINYLMMTPLTEEQQG